MVFFCFVESGNGGVPHMEPMPVETLDEARLYAGKLMGEHARSVAAHIFGDDERLDTVTPWLLLTRPLRATRLAERADG